MLSRKNVSQKYQTDVLIIGMGPVGLFAVFELGLLDMRCHLCDVLPKEGGQCAELYPEKPIYDIPAYPVISGQELTDNLMAQIKPFEPVFHYGEEAQTLKSCPAGWEVQTNLGKTITSRVVVIASGGGCFEPKKPHLEGRELYEGHSIFYAIRRRDDFKGKNVVVAGGGDSALDWVIALEKVAKSITLVHRREQFRAAPASVKKIHQLLEKGIIRFQKGQMTALKGEAHQLSSIVVDDGVKRHSISCDCLLPFFGLTMKPGPIANWDVNMKNNLIPVETQAYETNMEGVFAIGDICTYEGKLKLILSGFHEAALMAQKAYQYVFPGKKNFFQYTTSSSSLQKKLGVK